MANPNIAASCPDGTCKKEEVPDWCVILVFMDNHSGGVHGSGHAGVFIIDGTDNEGIYADFGTYNVWNGSSFGKVRVSKKQTTRITADGKLEDSIFGEIWSFCNEQYGSKIHSEKSCSRHGFRGPNHQYEMIAAGDASQMVAPKNFMVNGIVGWAAFRLKHGAYAVMKEYIDGCEKHVDEQLGKMASKSGKDPYNLASFNCMTFALNVYAQGRTPEKRFKTDCTNHVGELKRQVDHPNAHIAEYMARADDRGYFDDRKYRGEPEAVTNREQTEVQSKSHHDTVALVS